MVGHTAAAGDMFEHHAVVLEHGNHCTSHRLSSSEEVLGEVGANFVPTPLALSPLAAPAAMSITRRDIVLEEATEAITIISVSSGVRLEKIKPAGHGTIVDAILQCADSRKTAFGDVLLQIQGMDDGAGGVALRDAIGRYIQCFKPSQAQMGLLRHESCVAFKRSNAPAPAITWDSFAELCKEPGRFLGDLGWQVASDVFHVGVTFWTLKSGDLVFSRRLVPSAGAINFDVNIVERVGKTAQEKPDFVVVDWGNGGPVSSQHLPVTRRRGIVAVRHQHAIRWRSKIVAEKKDVTKDVLPKTLLHAYVNLQEILWGKGLPANSPPFARLRFNTDSNSSIDIFFDDGTSAEEKEQEVPPFLSDGRKEGDDEHWDEAASDDTCDTSSDDDEYWDEPVCLHPTCIEVLNDEALLELCRQTAVDMSTKQRREKWKIDCAVGLHFSDGELVSDNFFRVGKHQVCFPVYKYLYNWKRTTFYKNLREILRTMADKSSVNPDNLSLIIPDLEDFRRERTQGTPAHQALAWLKVYAKLSGEKLPYNLSGGPAIRQTKRKRGKAAGAAVAGGTDAGAVGGGGAGAGAAGGLRAGAAGGAGADEAGGAGAGAAGGAGAGAAADAGAGAAEGSGAGAAAGAGHADTRPSTAAGGTNSACVVPPEINCTACGCSCEASRKRIVREQGEGTEGICILAEGTKKDVWLRYCAYMLEVKMEGDQPIARTTFQKIWRENCPWIKVSKKKTGFAECQDCAVLKRGIASTTGKAKLELEKLLQEHRECQDEQRRKYYKHRDKAILRSGKYLSIIMDAMDQKKTDLPQLMRKPKDIEQTQGSTLKQKVSEFPLINMLYSIRLMSRRTGLTTRVAFFLKLMGVKVHGVGTWLYATSSPVATGSNFNIECLSRTLAHVKERNGFLPDTLYLQLGELLLRGRFLYGAFCLTSQLYSSLFHCAL